MASSRPIERGVACPGCPHRAAYVICKGGAQARARARDLRRRRVRSRRAHAPRRLCVRGRAVRAARPLQDPRPLGGTAQAPASEACVHFIPDTVLAGKDAASELGDIKAEGRVVILAVLASSRAFLTREAVEDLGARALDLGCDDAVVVDPFDSQRAMDVLGGALARPRRACRGLCLPVRSAPAWRIRSGARRDRRVRLHELPSLPANHRLPRHRVQAARLSHRRRGVRRLRPVRRVLPHARHLLAAQPHDARGAQPRALRSRKPAALGLAAHRPTFAMESTGRRRGGRPASNHLHRLELS